MKPFDPEAAKRGEPICSANGFPRYFIGIMKNKDIAVEDQGGQLIAAHASALRMVTKKKYVNIYRRFKDEDPHSMYQIWGGTEVDTLEEAERVADRTDANCRWLGIFIFEE